MTTLSIIPVLIAIFCHITLIILAITVFQNLHRMERRLHDTERKTSTTLMLAMENHLNNSVNMLNDMQRRLRILVEEEQYENAAQLRAVIKSQEQNLRRQIEQMRKVFGDTMNFELHIVGEKNDNENKNENKND